MTNKNQITPLLKEFKKEYLRNIIYVYFFPESDNFYNITFLDILSMIKNKRMFTGTPYLNNINETFQKLINQNTKTFK